jgi:transcriptional regulator ATRX
MSLSLPLSQVVSLVHTLLTNPELKIRTVLIVVPVNVLRNWSSEFDKWQGGDVQKVRKKVKVYTVEDAGS